MTRRSYISFNGTLAPNTEFDIETQYNASKVVPAERISDGDPKNAVSFGEIIFWYDQPVQIKLNSKEEPLNDYINYRRISTGSHFDRGELKVGGKNVIFRNANGGSLNYSIYATIFQQPGVE